MRRYNYFTEMCSGSEAGSYLRLIESRRGMTDGRVGLGRGHSLSQLGGADRMKRLGYVSGSEAGSYLRLIDLCITQL